MHLFCADTTIFSKKLLIFFVHKKLKNHPQNLLRKPQIHFFTLLP